MHARAKKTAEERFWPKVDKNGPVPDCAPHLGPCWLWKAFKFWDGYGSFLYRGLAGARAHRASYEMFVGPIPPGLCVLRRCNVRACVNPDHLWVGTKKQNSEQMVAQGRQQRGVERYNGKLTDAQCQEIRDRYDAGEHPRDIAKDFGIIRRYALAVGRRERRAPQGEPQ